jgi:ssDNA-binding Zn-finger/Zn-ribbon topoisomerase 1
MKKHKISCNQCSALMINGVFCHETGCPNSKKTWVHERQEWVRFVDCRECGYPVEIGEICDCQREL